MNVGLGDVALYSPQKNYEIRAVYTSVFSDDTDAKTVTDQFTLEIINVCVSNVLTQGTPLPDATYVITTATSTYTPTFTTTQAVGTCPLMAELFFYDETLNDWVANNPTDYPLVNSFDPATGSLAIFTTSYARYDPHTYLVTGTVLKTRIVISDPNSDAEGNQIVEEFDLTVKNRCADNTLTLTTEQVHYDYILDNALSP